MLLAIFFFNFLNECEITSVALMQKIRVGHRANFRNIKSPN